LREFELAARQPGGPLADDTNDTLARIWLDCTTPGRIRLTISDGPHTQHYRRDFNLEHGLDSVALELLALVLQSSLESLAAGRPIGNEDMESSPTPLPDAATPPDSVAAAGDASLDVGGTPDEINPPDAVGTPGDAALRTPKESLPKAGGPLKWYAHYDMRMMTTDEILHGPGFGAQLELSNAETPSAIAIAGFACWPIQVSTQELGARLQVYEARSLLSRSLSNDHGFSLDSAAGLSVLFTRVEPILFGSGAPGQVTVLASPFWTSSVVAQASGRMEWQFAKLSVAITLGAELDLSRVRFTLERDGRSQEVFAPWLARPRFGAALGF
jgi:hypothetical protein